MSELKPCPFCGSDLLNVVWINTYMCRVHCGGCGADGATCYSERAAVEWWDNRVPDKEVSNE